MLLALGAFTLLRIAERVFDVGLSVSRRAWHGLEKEPRPAIVRLY
jgi:hypothetical protein